MVRRTRPRRGVLLLIILSVLVLFGLVGTTFVVITSQYRSTAAAHARTDQHVDRPENLIDESVKQLLRGVEPGSGSVLDGHSLLDDLNGRDSVRGIVPGVAGKSAAAYFGTLQQWTVIPLQATIPVAQLPENGYYNGGVLTMTSGLLKGQSTRIIEYYRQNSSLTEVDKIVNGQPFVIVETFRPDRKMVSGTVTPTIPEMIRTGDQFLINGMPFNGAGAGYKVDTGNLDAVDPTFGVNLALMPNYQGRVGGTASPLAVGAGGFDESWDAVDYQNMFMSMIPSTATPNTHPAQAAIIPSFHRPDLMQYFAQNESSKWSQPGFRRMVSLRPSVTEHPNFDGSNPFLAAQMASLGPVPGEEAWLRTGPWDVDNDGDGIPDSVWVDLGFEVRTSRDGRLYKPLVAFLVRDLDGRINLNTAGDAGVNTETAPSARVLPAPIGVFGQGAAGTTANLVAGAGFSPAEIDLTPLGFNAVGQTAMLADRNKSIVEAAAGGLFRPGTGSNTVLDPLTQMALYGSVYRLPDGTIRSALPDIRGRLVTFVGIDGKPVHLPAILNQANITALMTNPPFATRVTNPDGRDDIFTLGELEPLLRSWDADVATLPGRLAKHVMPSETDPIYNRVTTHPQRQLVTTHSVSLPVPGAFGVASVAGQQTPHIVRNFKARLMANGLSDSQAEVQLAIMLPHEVRHGGKMDLNRLWGNGIDDDNDGYVDEADEQSRDEFLWGMGSTPGNQATNSGVRYGGYYLRDDPMFTMTGGRPNPNVISPAKQLFARHLYCMMMLTVPQNYVMPTEQILTPQQRQELLSQRIAQWAINVVDFRDSDATMTPFEYDANPFNGWQADGDLRTSTSTTETAAERRLVWGTESPQLLLTENFSFHDMRLVDSKTDDDEATGGKKRDQDDDGKDGPADQDDNDIQQRDEDDDLDQYRVPQGSTFFELFCVANTSAATGDLGPRELFDNQGRLDLGRIPAGSAQPVWRLAISHAQQPNQSPWAIARKQAGAPPRSDSVNFDPLRPDLLANPLNAANPLNEAVDALNPQAPVVDRIVWFCNRAPAAGDPYRDRTFFFGQYTLPAGPFVAPRQYVMVGPRQRTYLGERENGNNERYLEFNPAGGSDRGWLPRINWANGDFMNLRQNAVGIVATNVNKPTSWPAAASAPGINISEPLPTDPLYYDKRKKNAAAASYVPKESPRNQQQYEWDDAFGTPDDDQSDQLPDEPFDLKNPIFVQNNLSAEETRVDFRTVYLQRLADPTRPYDPLTNPYRTVDWMPMDLTVFNGTARNETKLTDQDWFTNKLYRNALNNNETERLKMRSRERGLGRFDFSLVAIQQPFREDVGVWKPVSEEPKFTQRLDGKVQNNGYYLRAQLDQLPQNQHETLGMLNLSYGPPRPSNSGPGAGGPVNVMPWLTWNDRLFNNPLELLQVPASSSARLTYEFYTARFQQAVYEFSQANPTTLSLFSVSPIPNAGKENDVYLTFWGPYGHLLNFFLKPPMNAYAGVPEFARVLDWVEVPSPYLDSRTWFNGASFDGKAPGFKPPFHYIPTFRDPGKVNINTVFDAAVWQALCPDQFQINFLDVAASRQGFAGNYNTKFPGVYPSMYANPFRSTASASLMPRLNHPTTPEVLRQPPMEASLLRTNAPLAGAQGSRTLLQYLPVNNHDNPNKNSQFRYQALQRLSNLVTNQSNVYAVWVTVGYFEVELNSTNPSGSGEKAIDIVHPNGYRLASELGADTGQIRRPRGFFIIDRSIPVGFEPGKDHNVEKTILLRRRLD
ncbi:MAG: hypothetical protein U0795_22695 [Pirellulales bacterium]